mgnify:FL=1
MKHLYIGLQSRMKPTVPMSLDPLATYRSIEAPSKLYETNTRPVLLSVADEGFNSYVVKHNSGRLPCEKLACELIAYYFLSLWGINTPRAAIIEVDPDHVFDIRSTAHQPRFFKVPCWGTYFHSESTEFLQFFEELPYYERDKFNNATDLLRIVLFDIWLGNDDRTANNPNILIVSTQRGFEFWPIDHEAIFNGNNLGKGLYELGEYDTLLYHPAVKKLLGKTLKDSVLLNELVEEAYVCIERCQQNIPEILSFIPVTWQLDKTKLEHLLRSQLFTEIWLRKLRNTFLSLMQQQS